MVQEAGFGLERLRGVLLDPSPNEEKAQALIETAELFELAACSLKVQAQYEARRWQIIADKKAMSE